MGVVHPRKELAVGQRENHVQALAGSAERFFTRQELAVTVGPLRVLRVFA